MHFSYSSKNLPMGLGSPGTGLGLCVAFSMPQSTSGVEFEPERPGFGCHSHPGTLTIYFLSAESDTVLQDDQKAQVQCPEEKGPP